MTGNGTCRLGSVLDLERLEHDLERLRELPFGIQPGRYHAGCWRGVALWSLDGDHRRLDAGTLRDRRFIQTPAALAAPYMTEMVDALAEHKRAVRVMQLPPGGRIERHRDPELTFANRVVRLHVPIVTDPTVEFVVGGQHCHWQPGELWYADFTEPHWVFNRSSVTRVHLVMDLWLDGKLRQLFPRPFVEQRTREQASLLSWVRRIVER
jgi:quercetin dioxygenase-like cupin family protein